MAAAVETRAAIIAKLQEELAARNQEKFDKLEENQLTTTQHLLALDKKTGFSSGKFDSPNHESCRTLGIFQQR